MGDAAKKKKPPTPTAAGRWTDATSYAAGRHGKDEPSVWALRAEGIRLEVHRLWGIPGMWFVTCRDVGLYQEGLDTDDLNTAKARALCDAQARLKKLSAALKAAMG